METLPREVAEQILALACTDGGPTACSIRASSSALCAACESRRFYTVLLPGEKQLRHFQATLHEASPAARAGVRHLFLVSHAQYAGAADDVIRTASRTLKSLTLLIESPCPELYISLLSTSFPRLLALSLRYPKKFQPVRPVPSSPVTFPRLRSLHVAYTSRTSLLLAQYGLCAFSARAGRNLERVRVSGVMLTWGGLAPDILYLRALLGIDAA